VCVTGRARARGQWQNPDVTRIAVERYHRLHANRIVVTTYEVKQFARWDVSSVYEAASHQRCSHEAWVVLEWPNEGIEFSLTDPTYRLDQLARECQRFDIGLATLHSYYSSFRLRPRIDSVPHTPGDEDIERLLDRVFSRYSTAEKEFENLMARKPLKKGAK
jgi:hypothetical protein